MGFLNAVQQDMRIPGYAENENSNFLNRGLNKGLNRG
jgi:hypothetical protein